MDARTAETIEFSNNPNWSPWGALAQVSVVIPTLNEAENLPHVLPFIPSGVHEVVIVDGYSIDGTVDVAKSLLPTARVVYEQKRGKGAALRRGFNEANGDIIVFLDADGSMNPSEIPAYIGVLLAGADFAKGSRFLQGGGTADMTLFRSFGNWMFRMSVRFLFGGNYSDLCYGYNAFWKAVLPQLGLDTDDARGDGFEVESLINVSALLSGLKVVEVPSFEMPRVHGQSHLRSFPDGWRMLRTILGVWVRKRRKLKGVKRPYYGYAWKEDLWR